jgi:hypothetical protein
MICTEGKGSDKRAANPFHVFTYYPFAYKNQDVIRFAHRGVLYAYLLSTNVMLCLFVYNHISQ